MKFIDYYRVLEVLPGATPEEIKSAYRRLARKYHPDVSKLPGTVQKFAEIVAAHDLLADPVRRAEFDRLRSDGWQDGQEMDAPPPQDRGYGRAGGPLDGDGRQASDLFESLFGGFADGRNWGPARGAAPQERGEDMNATIPVSLEESYLGTERQFTLRSPSIDAQGSFVNRMRTITVQIPKGVIQGNRIRLRGQGHPGSRPGMEGDLYLEVELAAHPWYQCEGCDVLLEVPIAPWEAVLGAKIDVPTLGGTVTATIPVGAQQGQKLRLKGRGLPHEPAGDQYLILQIVVPTTASEPVMDLYRALATASAFDPRTRFARHP